MHTMTIRGGVPLSGTLDISGSKNAALPILFATVLCGGACTLHRIPQISDTELALQILSRMGASVTRRGETVICDTTLLRPELPDPALTAKMRASCYLLGALLGRFGRAWLCGVGGCDFGVRPIDLHLRAFEALGARREGELLCADRLRGSTLSFPFPSVGATVNLLLAAVCAEGETVLRGAAREPHIVDTVRFLRACGASIAGEGSDTLRIFGGRPLHPAEYTVTGDMIEAGTYLCAVAATGGSVTLRGVRREQLSAPLAVLSAMGVTPVCGDDSITLTREPGRPLRGCPIVTAPYPGFPTDLQPPFAALLTRTETGGSITERVWADRFRYARELAAMGARLLCEGDTLTVLPSPLHGARVCAPDLRGGAALVIAALCASGETVITDADRIARGYAALPEKLRALGAEAEETTEP